ERALIRPRRDHVSDSAQGAPPIGRFGFAVGAVSDVVAPIAVVGPLTRRPGAAHAAGSPSTPADHPLAMTLLNDRPADSAFGAGTGSGVRRFRPNSSSWRLWAAICSA